MRWKGFRKISALWSTAFVRFLTTTKFNPIKVRRQRKLSEDNERKRPCALRVLQHLYLAALVTTTIAGLPASAQPAPPGTHVDFSLVKLDPSQATANIPFFILVNISNHANRRVTIEASQDTDLSPFTQQLDLEPLETRLVEMHGQFSTPGAHVVQVSVNLWSTLSLSPHSSGAPGWVPAGPASSKNIQVYSLQTAGPPRPVHWDLSPDQAGLEFSGVVQTLAGSTVELYAIPKTGGVWRSINGSGWHSIPSPPRAFSIAIDPRNSRHIAVGERADDDALYNSTTGHSGLWESLNEGDSWQYTYNPLVNSDSQRVMSVAFSQSTSTLIAATSTGIVRREGSSSQNALSGSFALARLSSHCTDLSSLGAITALTSSKSRLWARSVTHVFYSDDDGKTWECEKLRLTVDISSDPNLIADYNTTVNGGNDNNALGAFDDRAFIIFKQFVAKTDPRATYDDRCNPKVVNKYDPTDNKCQPNNKSAMIVFYPGESGAKRWRAQYTNDGDGRGLNGRRFVNTYEFDPVKCPTLVDRSIGKGRQIIYGSGQSIQQAVGLASDGTIDFDQVIATAGGGDAQAKHINVHSDMWDFLLPADYCRPDKIVGYFATDGGVDIGTTTGNDTRLTSMSWASHSAGLHVQTVQDLFVAESATVPTGVNVPPLPIQNIAYPTQDNDGWWRTQSGKWFNIGVGGDANFVAGDIAQPEALIWRRLETPMEADTGSLAALVQSDGTAQHFTLNVNQPLDGPTRIQAVQTLANEVRPDSAMDVVMLVQLPLTDKSGKGIADPPGATGSGSRFALIRNKTFSNAPDGPATGFKSWTVVADNLPLDTRRFWISGGHLATRYFIYTGGANVSCPNGVQSLGLSHLIIMPNGRRRLIPGTWSCLATNLLEIPGRNDSVPLHGPVFVNPYDSNMLVIASAAIGGSPAVIKISVDGGKTFCSMPILTNLLTESGRYPLVGIDFPGVYDPSQLFGAVGTTFHGYPLSVPSQVSFNRHAPTELVVSSPFKGIYFGQLMKHSRPFMVRSCLNEPAWSDLSSAMPPARAYVTSAILLNNSVVVSTEGYGVYGISNISSANMASFFQATGFSKSGTSIARLTAANGSPVAWGFVGATVRQANSANVVGNKTTFRTDESGNVILKASYPPGQYLVNLEFVGDGQIAPSQAEIPLSVAP